jgi:hypothetical protein
MALNVSGATSCPVCGRPLQANTNVDAYHCPLANGGCGLAIAGTTLRSVPVHRIKAAMMGQGSAVPVPRPRSMTAYSAMAMLGESTPARELKPKEIVAEPIEGWRLWRVWQPAAATLFTRDEIMACADAYDRGENPFRGVLLQPKLMAVGIGNIPWDKTMHARCEMNGPRHPSMGVPHGPDDVPVAHCMCGMWAFKTLDDLLPRLISSQRETGMAYGTVQMWGRIIEHEHGYRAQHARPLKVTLLRGNDDAIARALATFYDCDVGCGPLPDAALALSGVQQQLQQQNLQLQAQQGGGMNLHSPPLPLPFSPLVFKEPEYAPFPWPSFVLLLACIAFVIWGVYVLVTAR